MRHPDAVRARLLKLLWWYGDSRDATADVVASAHFDPEEVEKLRVWRHAYLGRYMGQQIEKWEGMTSREVQRYVEAVSEIVKKENGKSESE